MASQIAIKLHLDSTYIPAILDLEGIVPYDIVLQVRHGASDLTQQMNILADDSLFDIPHAFSNGLLKVIDLDSNEQVDLGFVAGSSTTASPKIISLPPRTPRLPLFQYDLVIPLQLNIHIKNALVPGHEYRVELDTLDLGIKWWNYGNDPKLNLHDPTPSLPPSEPAKLVAMKPTHRDFSVVTSLPKPGPVSIALSLSSDTVHRSKTPPTTVRVAVTNKGTRPITLRSSGDQSFIQPSIRAYDTPNMHRIASTTPYIGNFSITKISTDEEFIAEPRHTCSLTVGSAGKTRRGLITLEPDAPLEYEFVLLERADAIVKAMGDDDDFRLRLRSLGVWWFPGTIDDIFGDRETVRRLPGPCLPLILQSDDELRFRLEG